MSRTPNLNLVKTSSPARALGVSPAHPRVPDLEWLIHCLERPAPKGLPPASKRAPVESLYQAALEDISARKKNPVASQRVQFSPAQGFKFFGDRLAPYLSRMAVRAAYFAPALEALSGHGYDIADPTVHSAVLGGNVGYAYAADQGHAHGLSIIQDIVPNHFAVSPRQKAVIMWDLMEHGIHSRFAGLLDNEWLEGLTLPFGAAPLENSIHGLDADGNPSDPRGQLHLQFGDGVLQFAQWDEDRYPISPESYGDVVKRLFEGVPLEGRSRKIYDTVVRLSDQAAGMTSPTKRAAIAKTLKQSIVQLQADPATAARFGEPLDALGRDPAFTQPLLEKQKYRIGFWRDGENSYRMFFDIKGLGGARVEEARNLVFSHQVHLRDVKQGYNDADRVDHPDGMSDPIGYLQAKAEANFLMVAWNRYEQTPGADPKQWPVVAGTLLDLYRQRSQTEPRPPPTLDSFVEKINRPDQITQQEFSTTAGDTGYQASAHWTSHTTRNLPVLQDIHREYTNGVQRPEEEKILDAKTTVIEGILNGVVTRLEPTLDEIVQTALQYVPDQVDAQTKGELKVLYGSYLKSLDIYRTYVNELARPLKADDERAINMALRRVASENPDVSPLSLNLMERILKAKPFAELPRAQQKRYLDAARAIQQTTAPVQAKSVEDTYGFRGAPLKSLRDVGFHEMQMGLAEYHRLNAELAVAWPRRMKNSTTHDTKQGEGARARGSVLSEFPEEWRSLLGQLRPLMQELRGSWRQDDVEYTLLQAIVMHWPPGPWRALAGPPPLLPGEVATPEYTKAVQSAAERRGKFKDRLALHDNQNSFIVKWMREAKVDTNHIDKNWDFEEGAVQLARKVMEDPRTLQLLGEFKEKLEPFTTLNLLAQQQTFIANTGITDFYPGTELPDEDSVSYSFFDDDNRRDVDLDKLSGSLDTIDALQAKHGGDGVGVAQELMSQLETGLLHQYARRESLTVQQTAVDAKGGIDPQSYVELTLSGNRELYEHFDAFARLGAEECILSIAPRFSASLVGSLDDPEPLKTVSAKLKQATFILPRGTEKFTAFENILTGQRVDVRTTESGARVIDMAGVLDPLPLAHLRGLKG